MERPEKNLRWGHWLLITLMGSLLYAGTSWVTSFAATSSSSIAGNLRPGVAIPIFFGFVFGPLSGFLVGLCGNLLNDMIAGNVALSFTSPQAFLAGLMLNWQVGNGLMGLVAGFGALRHWRYGTRREIVRALLMTILAITVGIGVAALLDPVVYPTSYTTASPLWQQVLAFSFPIVLTNGINAAVIVPILLFNYEHLDWRATSFFHSGLLQRILLTIIISAAVPIILLSLFLLEANARLNGGWAAAFGGVFVQLAITVLLTTLFIITNAALMAQSITRSLINLSQAAQAMEKNTLSAEQAATLKATTGKDEIAQLSHVFGTMAEEVIEREYALRKQVQELQIAIDDHKRSEQVQEIVETDFFRDLKQKARTLRARRTDAPDQPDEQPA
ncbi:MAG: ECF transporter S component [Chloroflexales bacterium]